MRFLLLITLVCVLTNPAFAREIELATGTGSGSYSSPELLNSLSVVFYGKGETELFWDDGVPYSYVTDPDGSDLRIATDYTAPVDCHLTKIKFHLPSDPLGTEVGLYAYDNGSSEPGSEIGYLSHTGLVADWNEVDVTSMGVTLSNTEVFWVGLATSGDAARINRYNADNPGHSLYYSFDGGSNWNVWIDWVLMTRAIVDDDMDGPYAADQDPADGATGVAVNADILFDVQDDDIGVDSSTITSSSVVVTDDTKATISGTLVVDDSDPNDVHVTFDPDSDLVEGSVVTVTASPTGDEILDDLGNEMAEDSWSFGVISTGVESASLGEIKVTFK